MSDSAPELTVLRPRDRAVYCGVYRCDCDDGHECEVLELDQRPPRFPVGCSGRTWHLVTTRAVRMRQRRSWPNGRLVDDEVSGLRHAGRSRRIRWSSC